LFSVGDIVLVGSVVAQPSKLTLRWRGPAKIVHVITDYVMETQQLVASNASSVHHACRHFSTAFMVHEGGREVTEDLAALSDSKKCVSWMGNSKFWSLILMYIDRSHM
jgi:hypothetical protein